MTWIIILGVLLTLTLSALLYSMFGYKGNDKTDMLCCSFVFTVILGGVLAAAIYGYSQPHHGNKPEIDDFPNEACIDTIYTHHNGKTYVSYKLRWKDDKVWED